jgi:uncharacterized protein (TIGR03437 family)
MRSLTALAFAGLVFASAFPAQAVVTLSGVTNAADFSTAIAPASLATVFGSGFATAVASPAAIPWPATFNGVSITVNGRPAPITFLSPTQVNFQIPAATPVGNATLVVTVVGQGTATLTFPVIATAPGIFQYGTNRGVIQNGDFTLNTPAVPAGIGGTIVVYLTGIGATTPTPVDGAAAPSSPLARPTAVASATVGGVNAAVDFIGLTPGFAGLAQANVRIPNLTTGDHPVVVRLGNGTSRSVLVAVRGNEPPPTTGIPAGLPAGATCVSGSVQSISRSLERQASRLADDVTIGSTKLCATCQLKAPLFQDFVDKLELARLDNLAVDACYDSYGTLNYLRVRRP